MSMHRVIDDVIPVNELTRSAVVRTSSPQVWQFFEQIDLGEDGIGESLGGFRSLLGVVLDDLA